MENYIETLDSLETLKEQLFEILQVESQAKLAKSLNIKEATLSRMFSENKEYKIGPKIENVERIIDPFVKHKKLDENLVRLKIYSLIYSPNELEMKLKEFEILKKETFHEQETIGGIIENTIKSEFTEEAYLEKSSLNSFSEEKEVLLKRIKDVLQKIAKDCGFIVEDYKVSERSDVGVIIYVSLEYNSVFAEAYIDMIYGIYLSEANYNRTIHDVAELNTEDGIIILFYEDENVFDKAWRDEKLEVENNVLLYCLSKERKICVKSTRKQQKKFLKDLFGKERLLL